MEVAALAGPRCQGDLLDRPDLVTIVGEIIDEPLRVTGDVNLRVTAVSAGPGMGSERDGLLCVRLADQAPDGKTVVILEAAAPVPARHGRHHLSVRLGPIGWTFEPGHAPLLVFSRTSVPRFEAPHPNSPERLLIEIDEGLILTLPTAPLGEPA
jgi:predicted acyl esterase